ncbi:uncharacterized protein LDX57_000014 [Aspergillus melleus]|uniref:uncharacterized protein n=1 Tax=Aspergillus melleus TaxID=138277 RepID=UPI001E8CD21B|nr:uncharacterized protein LDX57_000014 [Aspergillus melleus]KAH8422256.1 hypothetical protein LDX57_000014 [Aspergillus melleus]
MPFLFYRYGAAIRARCHYATESDAFMEALFGKMSHSNPQDSKEEPLTAKARRPGRNPNSANR